MCAIVPSMNTRVIEMEEEVYRREYEIEIERTKGVPLTTNSLWMLERGQILILLDKGQKRISGYRCYYCGGSWHSEDFDLIEVPIEGKKVVCKENWGCGRRENMQRRRKIHQERFG